MSRGTIVHIDNLDANTILDTSEQVHHDVTRRMGGSAPRTTSSNPGWRLRCKSWGCSHCGPRKAKQYRAQIVKAVDRSKLTRLFKLTLDPRNIAKPDEIETFYAHYKENKAAQKSCSCPICTRVQRRAVPHIRQC
jgi:hypothetical protein